MRETATLMETVVFTVLNLSSNMAFSHIVYSGNCVVDVVSFFYVIDFKHKPHHFFLFYIRTIYSVDNRNWIYNAD